MSSFVSTSISSITLLSFDKSSSPSVFELFPTIFTFVIVAFVSSFISFIVSSFVANMLLSFITATDIFLSPTVVSVGFIVALYVYPLGCFVIVAPLFPFTITLSISVFVVTVPVTFISVSFPIVYVLLLFVVFVFKFTVKFTLLSSFISSIVTACVVNMLLSFITATDICLFPIVVSVGFIVALYVYPLGCFVIVAPLFPFTITLSISVFVVTVPVTFISVSFPIVYVLLFFVIFVSKFTVTYAVGVSGSLSVPILPPNTS